MKKTNTKTNLYSFTLNYQTYCFDVNHFVGAYSFKQSYQIKDYSFYGREEILHRTSTYIRVQLINSNIDINIDGYCGVSLINELQRQISECKRSIN